MHIAEGGGGTTHLTKKDDAAENTPEAALSWEFEDGVLGFLWSHGAHEEVAALQQILHALRSETHGEGVGSGAL
eukprot:974884-Prymnesium_polylepis.1